ncbi:MAG: hypothetical protein Devi2KO_39980 [Devosia indica]
MLGVEEKKRKKKSFGAKKFGQKKRKKEKRMHCAFVCVCLCVGEKKGGKDVGLEDFIKKWEN